MLVLSRSSTLKALLLGALLIPSLPAVSAICQAQSGLARATVIELFTSEGCSSCPPADRWLSGFAGRAGDEVPVIPLAFHVDYWDSLGWPDRFASPRFTQRQNARVTSRISRFAYTPQIVVNAQDSSDWRQAPRSGQLALLSVNAAEAKLWLRLKTGASGRIDTQLDAALQSARDEGKVVAYLALVENGLNTEVRAGENAGRQLRHDFVVREWVGPLPIEGRSSTIHHTFMRPDVAMENASIAAVLELSDGTRQLQAVSLPVCR